MIPERNEPASTWALRGRAVCTPDGIRPAAILVEGETIAAIVDLATVKSDMPVVDVGENLILPGLVETHAHINEPGRTEWEGFASATRAAAAGGITTLVDMPLNSTPVTTNLPALRLKQQTAAGKIWVDCGFHGGVVPGNAADVQPLLEAGVCAFKAFLCHSGIDEFPNVSAADLRTVMPLLAKAGVPLFAHCELVGPLPEATTHAFRKNPKSYAHYLATRPPAWEEAAIRLLIELCREYSCPVHIVHLAAAREIRPLLREAKKDGLPVTVETCPHYLHFAAESIPDGDTRYKCAPPIREARQRDILREMLHAGEIDTIGSDHSPAPPDLKQIAAGDLAMAWGGIASLQLMLPIVWTTLAGDRNSRARCIASALAQNPARLAGLGDRKGAIAPGLDADFAIFDPDAEFVVETGDLHHRHKASPYEGCKLSGRVRATFLRGDKIYAEGCFLGGPGGNLLARSATWPTSHGSTA